MLDAALWLIGPSFLLLALIGIGDLLLPRDLRLPVGRHVAAAAIGLLTLMAAVPLANLVVPLGTRTAAVTLSLGAAGVLLARRRGHLPGAALAEVTVAAVVAAGLYRLTSPLIPIRFLTDTVVYHLPHMEWIARSALPLGTANLQTRLGFNPGFMTLASALRWEPLGQSHLFLLEVALRGLFLLIIVHVLRHARAEDRRLWALTLAVGLAALPFFAINKSGTDGNVGFLTLGLVVIALAVIRSPHDDRRRDGLALVATLVALAATFKLSAATTALLLLPLLTGPSRLDPRTLLHARYRPLALVAALAVAGWVTRSLAITGCLAFPLAASCTSAPWSVGREAAGITASHVTEFARRIELSGGSVALLDMTWVIDWLPGYLTSVPSLAVLGAVPVAVIGWARHVAPGDRTPAWLRWSSVAPAALPVTLIVFSLADLLGGRRFLGIEPSMVGVLEDYPSVEVLVAVPVVGLVVLLAVAALAPRHIPPAGAQTSDVDARGPIRALLPFLTVAAVYWFVSAPAVRFAWALHVVVAALLLSGWIRTVRTPRPSARTTRAGSSAVIVGSLAVVIGLGAWQPVLPIAAPDPGPTRRIILDPAGFTVVVPDDSLRCSTVHPCAPTAVEAVTVTRSLGRPIVRPTAPALPRLRRELGIAPLD